MNAWAAAWDTCRLIEEHAEHWSLQGEGLTIEHMKSMMERWRGDMSQTKKSRWLGWIQGVAVAALYPHVTLEDMKQINMRHKGE